MGCTRSVIIVPMSDTDRNIPDHAHPVPLEFGSDAVHQPGPIVPATSIEFPEPEASEADPAMGHDSEIRAKIRAAKRVVVKIGSSSLTDDDGRVSPGQIDMIADALEARMDRGTDLIVVSSGAVA